MISFSVSPHILPFSFGEDSINSGDFTNLHCSVHKGDLPIEISWLFNNMSIHNLYGITISKVGPKVSSLTIDSVQEDHAGLYTCVAVNAAGKVHFSVELNVNGN